MYIKHIEFSPVQPSRTDIGWAKPVKGGFALYVCYNGRWSPLVLMDDVETENPDDDIDAIEAVRAYADSLADTLESKILAGKAYKGTVSNQAALPTNLTEEDAGKYYILTEEGKFAYWNGTSWDLVDQETTVINAGASLKVGTAVKVAEIEGVAINVTQVEDTTKIEAVAVADTTDYADVSSLFVAG